MGVAKPLSFCFFFFLSEESREEEEEDESEEAVPVELKEFTSDLDRDRDDALLYLLKSFFGMFTMSFMVKIKIQETDSEQWVKAKGGDAGGGGEEKLCW